MEQASYNELVENNRIANLMIRERYFALRNRQEIFTTRNGHILNSAIEISNQFIWWSHTIYTASHVAHLGGHAAVLVEQSPERFKQIIMEPLKELPMPEIPTQEQNQGYIHLVNQLLIIAMEICNTEEDRPIHTNPKLIPLLWDTTYCEGCQSYFHTKDLITHSFDMLLCQKCDADY